jgi:hypothetical protein
LFVAWGYFSITLNRSQGKFSIPRNYFSGAGFTRRTGDEEDFSKALAVDMAEGYELVIVLGASTL